MKEKYEKKHSSQMNAGMKPWICLSCIVVKGTPKSLEKPGRVRKVFWMELFLRASAVMITSVYFVLSSEKFSRLLEG